MEIEEKILVGLMFFWGCCVLILVNSKINVLKNRIWHLEDKAIWHHNELRRVQTRLCEAEAQIKKLTPEPINVDMEL